MKEIDPIQTIGPGTCNPGQGLPTQQGVIGAPPKEELIELLRKSPSAWTLEEKREAHRMLVALGVLWFRDEEILSLPGTTVTHEERWVLDGVLTAVRTHPGPATRDEQVEILTAVEIGGSYFLPHPLGGGLLCAKKGQVMLHYYANV